MRNNGQSAASRHVELLDVHNVCAYCAGYVAVTKGLKERNGERDLVVVFRGTQAKAEWISNIVCDMVEWSELQTSGPKIKVERVRTLPS